MRHIGDRESGAAQTVAEKRLTIDDLPVLQSTPFVPRGQIIYAVEKVQITLRHPGALYYVVNIGYVFGIDRLRSEVYFSSEGLKDGQGVFALSEGRTIPRHSIVDYQILTPSGMRILRR